MPVGRYTLTATFVLDTTRIRASATRTPWPTSRPTPRCRRSGSAPATRSRESPRSPSASRPPSRPRRHPTRRKASRSADRAGSTPAPRPSPRARAGRPPRPPHRRREHQAAHDAGPSVSRRNRERNDRGTASARKEGRRPFVKDDRLGYRGRSEPGSAPAPSLRADPGRDACHPEIPPTRAICPMRARASTEAESIDLGVVAVGGFVDRALRRRRASRRSGAGQIDYARQVKPLLTRHCVACHGAARTRAGLRLDTAAAALKGGKNGPVIQPGHGEESPLILALRGEGSGERMPLNRPPLSEADIALLRDWIDQGARGMADEPPGVPPAASHWAFVPPRRPDVPDGPRDELGPQPDRPLHPGPARARRALAVARGRTHDPAPPRQPRPDRPAPVARGGRAGSWPIDRRIVTSGPSTACWPRPISASDGRGPGSTRPAMPTRTATASTPRARSGSTATGSSPPSTPTCRSTGS